MYTSLHPITYYFYPLFDTASSHGILPSQVHGALTTPAGPEVESLLYIHIPYCHDLCRFCPFHVRVDNGEETYRRYVAALCAEIDLIADMPRVSATVFKAVYFGGGSPSILPSYLLRQLFDTLRRRFTFAPDVEISFEGEPRSLGDPARLEEIKRFGTTRISFGLQTYDEALRKHFNIAATLEDVKRAGEMGHRFGFEEINVDMMFNLPGQTVRHLREDVARFADAGFHSVDYYNLHYYAFPRKFNEQMAAGEIPPKPSDGVMLALAEELRHLLPEAGYRNVADQVYAKTEKVCEYFRLLWGGGAGRHDAETIALGASARGYVDGLCYMNFGSTNRYIESAEAGALPIEKVSGRLANPHNRGAVLFSKFFTIDKRHEQALSSIPREVFNAWIDAGYLYDDGDCWRLSERGKLWTNNITRDAFEESQKQTAQGALVKLSSKPGIRTGTF